MYNLFFEESNLVTTQKSVRELKLALGRLMNYLYTTSEFSTLNINFTILKCIEFYLEVEIPSSLNIRPVLIAHSINDGKIESYSCYFSLISIDFSI